MLPVVRRKSRNVSPLTRRVSSLPLPNCSHSNLFQPICLEISISHSTMTSSTSSTSIGDMANDANTFWLMFGAILVFCEFDNCLMLCLTKLFDTKVPHSFFYSTKGRLFFRSGVGTDRCCGGNNNNNMLCLSTIAG